MNRPKQLGERPTGVKSAIRVLDVLEYFARKPEPASLAKLCSELDMPKSSGHALLETLRQQGYLYWMGRQPGYYPTRRWRDLGEAVTRHDPILTLLSSALHRVCERSGETAILAKREESRVLYLDVVEPDSTLRFSAYAGQIKPIHSAASGRALLALMDPDERDRLLDKLTLQAFSEHTITDLHDLTEKIEQGQKRGFHVAIGEYQQETAAIAVGFEAGGESYALLIGGPAHRLESRIDEVGAILMEEAAAVGKSR